MGKDKIMKVTDLLELLDEYYPEGSPHILILYGDYSGCIRKQDETDLVEFSNYVSMQAQLNALYASIKKQKIKFEL